MEPVSLGERVFPITHPFPEALWVPVTLPVTLTGGVCSRLLCCGPWWGWHGWSGLVPGTRCMYTGGSLCSPFPCLGVGHAAPTTEASGLSTPFGGEGPESECSPVPLWGSLWAPDARPPRSASPHPAVFPTCLATRCGSGNILWDGSVLVCSGCHNKIQQVRWLWQQTFSSSQFWRLGVQDQSVGWQGWSPKACLLELQTAASLLTFTWPFPCSPMPLVILPLPVKTQVRLD